MTCCYDPRPVLLSLLDCFAAFNLVSCQILLGHLQQCLGVSGPVLEWFISYLTDRSQSVLIMGTKSSASPLSCGVPQGLVLGPILFTIYTISLGDIIWSHHAAFHLYADDSQLYLACDNTKPKSVDQALSRLEACIGDIRLWMPQNQLKLNDSKTEFLFIHSKFRDKSSTPTIMIACNLGVLFDDNLTLWPHVMAVCKTAYYQIHGISCIRKFLTSSAVKTIVHSLPASRLDYCNSALVGLPDITIHNLQSFQNSAARLVCLVKKTDHITPVLMELH